MPQQSRYIVALYVIIVHCTFVSGCERVNISNYNGDGSISITSPDFISYGYKIEFDTFSFMKPFSIEYKISNLPEIRKSISVGISTTTDKHDLENFLEGELSLKALTYDNQVLFNCSASLKEWNYGKSRNDDNLYEYFIYFFDGRDNQTGIDHKLLSRNQGMTLFVNYNPKSTDIDLNGTIQLKAGGFY